MSRLHHAREPKKPQQQRWGPRSPQRAASPQNAWTDQPQGPSPVQPPHRGEALPPRKKRRRIFFWVFLAIQILFLIWVITGAASGSGTPASCQGLTGDSLKVCKDAGNAGTAIGVGLIIGLWVAVDVILGITYAIFRIATRQPRT